MVENQSLFDEIVDELGTQSLARLKLNIFDTSSYDAYMQSARLTTIMGKTTVQHGQNPNGFGQFYETLEVGLLNIDNTYHKTGQRYFTTDELADIQKVGLDQSSKTHNELKTQTIVANYSEKEIQEILGNENLQEYSTTNHHLVDMVAIDGNGNVVRTAQLKAVNNNIFSKKYDKYFKEGIEIYVDSDTYNRAEQEIEEMRRNLKNAPQDQKGKIEKNLQEKEEKFKLLTKGGNKENAGYTDKYNDKRRELKESIDKLKQEIKKAPKGKKETLQKELEYKQNEINKLTHTDSDRAMREVYMIQAKQAVINVVQTGASDALVVMLSTFASGAIAELKSEFIEKRHEDFSIRIKRLLTRTMQSGADTFARGASFGFIDVLVGIASQFFTQIGGHLKKIWSNLRASAKSIWNAIYSYITGKITSLQELMRTVLKALFSAVMVAFGVALEEQLAQALSFLPIVGRVLAIGISILVCSLAVVVFSRSVDLMLNGFFGLCAAADMARKRREEIESLFDEIMPKMLENQANLKNYIEDYLGNLTQTAQMSFAELQKALAKQDYCEANKNLVAFAGAFGVNDLFCTREDFDCFMQSDKPLML